MVLKGSSGLTIDLGHHMSEQKLKHLYDYIWRQPEFIGPTLTMDLFMGVPRAAEGKLELSPEYRGHCYTKIERDTLGYLEQGQGPVLLTISAYQFKPEIETFTPVFDYLFDLAKKIYSHFPYSLAIIGDTTLHYINSQLLHPTWFDHHNPYLQAVFIPQEHPLNDIKAAQVLPDTLGLCYYDKQALTAFVTDSSNQDKAKNLSNWAKSQLEKLHIQ